MQGAIDGQGPQTRSISSGPCHCVVLSRHSFLFPSLPSPSLFIFYFYSALTEIHREISHSPRICQLLAPLRVIVPSLHSLTRQSVAGELHSVNAVQPLLPTLYRRPGDLRHQRLLLAHQRMYCRPLPTSDGACLYPAIHSESWTQKIRRA